jgi:hypothetical protein
MPDLGVSHVVVARQPDSCTVGFEAGVRTFSQKLVKHGCARHCHRVADAAFAEADAVHYY